MADLPPAEVMKLLEQQAKDTMAAIKDVGSHMGNLNDVAAKTKQTIEGVAHATLDAAKNVQRYSELGGQLSKIDDFFTKHKISLETFNEILRNNQNLVADLAAAFVVLVDIPVPQYFADMGDKAKNSLGSVKSDYDKTIGVIADKIPGVGALLNKLGSGFAIRFDAARDAENSLLQMKAQAGDLGDTFKKFGNDLSGIDRMMDDFGNQVLDVSNRTGVGSEKVRELAQQLGQIPGRLEGMSGFVDSTGQKMDNLTAVLKISRGTFHDVSKVMDVVNQQYSKLGTSQDNALKLVARMHSATQQLGLPLQNMTTLISKSAEAYKFLGDNSQAALTIMGGLAPALKQSGLGPEAITELVSGITGGIAQLDVAQRAFISGQAGGPGGLQGAAQIQLLQQQGKTDEVYNMIQQGLAKQAGPAISLKEAAGDQGLAAQRQKQIAFLTQGPFGKLVGDEQGASKLLDAMKAGTANGKSLLSAQEATKTAITKGEAEQKRQTTVLTTVQNQMDRLNQAATQEVYLLARQAVGSDNKKIEEILLRSAKSAQEDLSIRTHAERVRATEVGIGPTGAIPGGGRLPHEAVGAAIEDTLGKLRDAATIIAPPGPEEPSKNISFEEKLKQLMAPYITNAEPTKLPPQKLIEQAATSNIPERTAPGLVHKAAEAHAAATAAATTHGGAGGKEPVKDYNINVNYVDLEKQLRNIAMIEVKSGRAIVESRNQSVAGVNK